MSTTIYLMIRREKIMSITNEDIRLAVYDAGLKLWQIADKLKLNDGNFSRKLRHELSQEDKSRIISIIEGLKRCNNG
jgi:hypothetical protein